MDLITSDAHFSHVEVLNFSIILKFIVENFILLSTFYFIFFSAEVQNRERETPETNTDKKILNG